MFRSSPHDTETGHPFWNGVHFAFVQNALYLSVGLHINFSLLSYFLVVLSWLMGSLVGLSPRAARFPYLRTVLFSTLAAVLFLGWLPRQDLTSSPGTWLVVQFVAVLAGIQAGSFFRQFRNSTRIPKVLFKENNGFIFGILLAISLFLDFGTRFLMLGPVVSLAFLLLSYFVSGRVVALVFLTTAAGLLSFGLSGLAIWLSVLFVAPAFLPELVRNALSKRLGHAGGPAAEAGAGSGISSTANHWLLAGAGFCLVLLQTFVVRAFSSAISSCELSILVVSAVYLSGFSVSYAFARFLTQERVARAAIFIFLFQIAYLLAGPAFFGGLIHARYSIFAMVGISVLLMFFASSLFAVILPKETENGVDLSEAYFWELAGGAFAVVLLLLLQKFKLPYLMVFYTAAAAAVTFALSPNTWRRPVGVVCSAIVVGMVFFGGRLARLSVEKYYEFSQGRDVTLLHSESNFYHQIDVIESQSGRRVAYLNGVRFFGDDDMVSFNHYLAEFPARFLQPKNVLILGAGSLTTVKRIAPHAKAITLVEIDPDVADISLSYFSKFNEIHAIAGRGYPLKFVFDDARHFLRTTSEQFDLIVFDISSPYYLQTATLHTVEFFKLVRSRLSPRGVFSICTGGAHDAPLGLRLTSTVARVFNDFQLMIVPEVNGFLYASPETMPWQQEAAIPLLYRGDPPSATGVRMLDEKRQRDVAASYPPLSLQEMNILVSENVSRIRRRLRW